MSRVCKHCPRTGLTDADFYSTRNICKRCAIKKNNVRAKKLREKGTCVDCMQAATPGFSRCESCKKAHRERYHANRVENSKTSKERRRRLKQAAFSAYGGAKCTCCSDEHLEFLSIDHIAGNGAEHRRQLMAETGWTSKSANMCGSHFYLWLKKQGYPPGFRVLCMNCNFSIAKFGYCPHQGKLRAAMPAQNEVLQ